MATTAIIRKYTDLSALMTVAPLPGDLRLIVAAHRPVMAPMVVAVIPSKLNGTTVDVKTVDGYNLVNACLTLSGGCALPYNLYYKSTPMLTRLYPSRSTVLTVQL